ncbi:MAG: HopJ type III effector protein [Methylococcales bacterium]
MENDAGTNEGSCKIFFFALLHGLEKDKTLKLFGDYYRIDIL